MLTRVSWAAACVLAILLPSLARADEGAYGHLDFSRMSKPQEEFFWRRLKSLAVEEAVLGYCGQADDFESRAREGIRSCVTSEALDKADAAFKSEVKATLESLHARKASCKGKPEATNGWLGVELGPAGKDGAPAGPGAYVAGAVADSPAAAADFKAGDIITSVNGEAVASPKELSAKIRALRPGAIVQLGVLRDGAGRTTSVKLGAMAFDQQGRMALDMPALIASSKQDLRTVADEVADMCGKCKTSIWAMFCR